MDENTNEAVDLNEAGEPQGAPEQKGAAPEGKAAPEETVDWKAEAEKWKAQARKWEGKVKRSDKTAEERLNELEERVTAAEKERDDLRHEKELSTWAAEVAEETGVPAGILRGDTRDELLAHAEAIKATLPTNVYPIIPDSGKPAKTKMTKEEILAIKDPAQRRAAIAEHADLFK